MNQQSFHSMLDALHSAGLRLTPQRKAICRLLSESEEHPGAQRIYELLRPEYDSLSLATVYNTLETLSQLGVVNVLGKIGDNDSVRYDADTGPHVNLACVRCHRIIDLPGAPMDDLVSRLDQQIEQTSGYALLGARVLYYGLCPDCQAEAGKKPA